MRFLQRFSLLQIQITMTPYKPLLHTQSKKERPNETLKRYLKSNFASKALLLFSNLLRKKPSLIDSFSVLYVIKACTQKSLLVEGIQIHDVAIKLGYEPSNLDFLQAPLINMYSAVAELSNAHRVFDEIPTKNVFVWTALIAAYVNNKKPNKALQLFREMEMSDVEPDRVTLTVALSACADLGALDMGERIDKYARLNKEIKIDLCLDNALVNMYTKCGDIETAEILFDKMKKKDVTTWTSMIVGYALHGQAQESLALFAKMMQENHVIIPNEVTFVGVLMACSHAGLVEQGKSHFKSMINDYNLKPNPSHFGCMVDLLCRAGLLQEAYNFILAMPVNPNAVMWRTLLGVCGSHGNADLAAEAHIQLLKLEERVASDDVAMSNVYASKGMWDKKMVFREKITERRAPGRSSIEIGSRTHDSVPADEQ